MPIKRAHTKIGTRDGTGKSKTKKKKEEGTQAKTHQNGKKQTGKRKKGGGGGGTGRRQEEKKEQEGGTELHFRVMTAALHRPLRGETTIFHSAGVQGYEG